MRAGPGLGNIGPEQGDYNQIVHGGGHGNYKNIVLAPNSVQEMCDLTMKAFELADKWRNPVVVLADGTLGQMAEPLVFPEKAIEPKDDKPWAVKGTEETMENLITSIFNDFNDLIVISLFRSDVTESRSCSHDVNNDCRQLCTGEESESFLH